MNDPSSKFNKLIIIKKSEIEAILAGLRAEKKTINQQQPQQLNPAAYNDYRWLIKAEEETDGQQT